MPFLEQLVQDYTIVSLDHILGFKSKYSLVLYKLISSWNDNKKAKIQRYLTTEEQKKEETTDEIFEHIIERKNRRYKW